MQQKRSLYAFTLIELSIVLVIFGLMVGGMLAGQSLIRAAQIRAVTVEFNEFSTAINAFKDKYGAYPGDFDRATQLWGTDPRGCPRPPSYDGIKMSQTCDGNGDGKIAHTSAWAEYFELYRAWQHLADAGMVKGQFVGRAGNGVPYDYQTSIIGMNIPASRVGNAGWSFYPLENSYITDPTFSFDNGYVTPLLLSAPFNSNDTITAILSGPEAWKIDTKIDDGKPGYGTVSSWKNQGPGLTCLTTDVQVNSAYVLTDETLRCSLIFKYD